VDADEGKKGHHSDQKFAEVMSQKTDAVSEFAKKKSYREQRQYLPIFAVRNEVMYSFLYVGVDAGVEEQLFFFEESSGR